MFIFVVESVYYLGFIVDVHVGVLLEKFCDYWGYKAFAEEFCGVGDGVEISDLAFLFYGTGDTIGKQSTIIKPPQDNHLNQSHTCLHQDSTQDTPFEYTMLSLRNRG